MTEGVDVARSMIGLQDVRDNEQIRDFLKRWAIKGDIDIDPSTTAWCAAFINACERAVGNKGTGRLNARSFIQYGNRVDPSQAKEGDIAVFAFHPDNAWQGHVTYVNEVLSDSLSCLGGNQSGSVCITTYSKQFLLSIRRI